MKKIKTRTIKTRAFNYKNDMKVTEVPVLDEFEMYGKTFCLYRTGPRKRTFFVAEESTGLKIFAIPRTREGALSEAKVTLLIKGEESTLDAIQRQLSKIEQIEQKEKYNDR